MSRKKRKKGGEGKRNARHREQKKKKRLTKSPRQMFRKEMAPPDRVVNPRKGGKYDRQRWQRENQEEINGYK